MDSYHPALNDLDALSFQGSASSIYTNFFWVSSIYVWQSSWNKLQLVIDPQKASLVFWNTSDHPEMNSSVLPVKGIVSSPGILYVDAIRWVKLFEQLYNFIRMSYVEALAPPWATAVILNLNILLEVVISGSWTTGAAETDEVMVIGSPAWFWISPIEPPEI
jgi:hypothetical protein